MIKFLIQRPIAVLMAFTACFIIGLVTYSTLPISLLPNIAIPEITIQVSAANTSARELENTIVKPLRSQLIQVSTLKDIHSESRDGAGIIRLSFDFGTNTDLAFIEVNEKIDAAMNYLPKETERPKVIKASATDIPVFYLNLTLKNDSAYSITGQQSFLDLCEFAESVIKRRIEQLEEVAMVDVTGLVERQVQIVPDEDMLSMLGISIEDIESTLAANNVEPGSMTVRDGYYEYNIKFSTLLRTAEDVKNIYLRKGDRIVQLKDFCRVNIVPVKEKGVSVSNGKRAVTLAVIKQADENMDKMKKSLVETMEYFQRVYPDIDFSISRNQTELLDYTISNLQQNLSLGFLFICLVAVLFLGDVKSPLVIGLSMVVSIVISFVFFYLCNMSLNIISLAGLILALGMMIDSSIIVTENISQYRERGYSLRRACITGTSEVVTPMLSSSLTTIAVFAPLIFMSGIAGAIFYDQAFSVTVGLMVSYFTGIMLLPVLYLLVYRTGIHTRKWKWLSFKFNNPIKDHTLDRFYDAGVDWVFSHKTFSVLFCAISIPLCVFFFFFIDKQRMPDIEENELIARIEWNENIHVDENRRRVDELFKELEEPVAEHTASIGRQDFLLNRERELSSSEAELYFRTETPETISPLQQEIYRRLKERYPLSVISSHGLGNQNRNPRSDSQKDAKQNFQRLRTCSHRRQSCCITVIPNNQRIYCTVKLLQDISHTNRNGKNKSLFYNRAAGHIHQRWGTHHKYFLRFITDVVYSNTNYSRMQEISGTVILQLQSYFSSPLLHTGIQQHTPYGNCTSENLKSILYFSKISAAVFLFSKNNRRHKNHCPQSGKRAGVLTA